MKLFVTLQKLYGFLPSYLLFYVPFKAPDVLNFLSLFEQLNEFLICVDSFVSLQITCL